MKRPLCMLCLMVIFCVAVYLQLYPPADFSYGEAAGEEVCLTGQVYRKEFQKGPDGPVLILYVKPEKLRYQENTNLTSLQKQEGIVSDLHQQEEIPFQNNFICVTAEGSKEPPVGSRVVLSGRLQEYAHATNPGQFDTKEYYAILGISARIVDCRLVHITGSGTYPAELLWRCRCFFRSLLQRAFDERTASFLQAMLLGEKWGLETTQTELYRNAGILHIISISGTHVSLIGLSLYKLLRKAGVPVLPASVCCGICIILYGEMIGMPVSAVRAIFMFLLRLLAQCSGRTYDMQTALLVCGTGMLLENPLYLYHAGFLLSFSAVLGVCVLKPALTQDKNIVMDSLLTSVAVAVVTLPIQLNFYYEVSVYAVLWNLLVLPLAGICMGTGILAACIAPFVTSSLNLPGLCASAIIRFYETGSSVIEKLPENLWCPGKPKMFQIVLFLLLITPVLTLKKLKLRYRMGFLCGAVLVFGIQVQSGLEVTFLDVGQGDCICMQLPDGMVWLCDGGSSDLSHVGQYRIEPFLKEEGITEIDAVFLSHGDSDHINGIEELLERGNIKCNLLVLPCTEKEEGESRFTSVLSMAKTKEIPVLWLEAGMEWTSGAVTARCLHPADGFEAANENAGSEVLYISYANFSMLLAGDVEGEGEEALLQELYRQNIKNITVFKVSHHGSRYSNGEKLIEQIRPRISLISCSADNRYGHPHQEVLDRLTDKGSYVFSTAWQGAVVIQAGAETKVRCFTAGVAPISKK